MMAELLNNLKQIKLMVSTLPNHEMGKYNYIYIKVYLNSLIIQ